MAEMKTTASNLIDAIKEAGEKKTSGYDTAAEVKRIEGKTAWVHIPGGVDETPVQLTVNAAVGDTVQLRVSGGSAWIVGNKTAPPTDDTTANVARTVAVEAKETADAVEGIAVSASTTATTAKTIAEGVNEHFWHDSGGAHVTEVTQEEWNDPGDPNYHNGGNTLITTQGMAIRDGLTNLAQFGSTGAVIGQNASGESRSEISTSGMQIIQNVSGVDTAIANLGYGPGTDSVGGTSDAPYYTLGTRRSGSTIGNYSVASGYRAEASGYGSFCEGVNNTATQAYSHAEGYSTDSNGDSSHSEGIDTKATATGSHAQNWGTIADQNYQTAIGIANTANNSNNLFVIGNGYYSGGAFVRSDAFTVDRSGNVEAAGQVTADKFYSEKTDGQAFHHSNDGSGGSIDTGLIAERTDQNTKLFVGVGGGGVNHGIYSNKNNRWMIYDDATGITKLPASEAKVGGDTICTKSTLVMSSHTLVSSLSINANTTTSETTTDITKTDYYPVGIVGQRITGTNPMHCVPFVLRISAQADGKATVQYRIRNNASATATISISINILWIKL